MRRGLHIVLVSSYADMQVGLGAYARCLLAELAELGTPHRFSLVSPTEIPVPPGVKAVAVHAPAPAMLKLAVWDQVAAWRAVRGLRADLVHWLQPRTSLLRAAPLTVMTLADAIQWREADYRRVFLRRYGRTWAAMARRADRVITISEHARSEIVELLAVEPERIAVTYLAAPPLPPASGVRAPVEPPYVLVVGGSERRKNAIAAIEAFAEAQLPQAMRLVLVGSMLEGPLQTDIAARVAQFSPAIRERILVLGHRSAAELDALYRSATIFAFPTLCEGFGLPVLEAMQRGTPVITSSTTSLPEVADGAALLIDPSDVGALQTALEKLAGDDAARADLRARGLRQAGNFTWRKTAEATVTVYEELAASAASAGD